MQPFIRGQRAKISAFSSSRKFEVSIQLSSAKVRVFDFVCFGIDEKGVLSDDRFMVFFNQKSAPDDAIVLAELSDQSARFAVDLDKVPPSVARLVFTASVEGSGAMRDLNSGAFTLSATASPVLEYRFAGGDFQNEGALMIAELYRKDEQWRVWAQGQGFAGDLSALLKHFGGLEIEETAPVVQGVPAPVAAQPRPTPAPFPTPPVPPSPAISPSMPVKSAPIATGVLQGRIAQTPRGGTLSLAPGEYQGPIVLDKPITLDGNGAVVWAHCGPVVSIASSDVSVFNLDIEVTAPDASVPSANFALCVAQNTEPRLQSVRVRGEVEGVAGLDGQWQLPPALELGEFAPRTLNSFILRVGVPGNCDIKTRVAGVSFHPARLRRGENEVEIRVENVPSDIFLVGAVELESEGVARTLAFSGRAAPSVTQAVRGRVL